MPPSNETLKVACARRAYETSVDRFPKGTPAEQMAAVSNVLFISYICPAIISPQTYGLCSVSTAPNAIVHR